MILTVLTVEQYRPNDSEDECFRDLLAAVRTRLTENLVVANPVPGSFEVLTKTHDAPAVQALVEQLDATLSTLQVLDQLNCRRSQALRAWKTAFKTTYFDVAINDAEEAEKEAATTAVRQAPYVPKPWCR